MENSQHTGISTDQNLQMSFHLSHPDKIELKKISIPLLKIKIRNRTDHNNKENETETQQRKRFTDTVDKNASW